MFRASHSCKAEGRSSAGNLNIKGVSVPQPAWLSVCCAHDAPIDVEPHGAPVLAVWIQLSEVAIAIGSLVVPRRLGGKPARAGFHDSTVIGRIYNMRLKIESPRLVKSSRQVNVPTSSTIGTDLQGTAAALPLELRGVGGRCGSGP